MVLRRSLNDGTFPEPFRRTTRKAREWCAQPVEWGSWGHSSAGRAPALQAGGRRFDPGWLHKVPANEQFLVRVQSVGCLAQERGWVAAGVGVECFGEVDEQRAVLGAAGRVCGEQPGGARLAIFGLAAEAELAIDDGTA